MFDVDYKRSLIILINFSEFLLKHNERKFELLTSNCTLTLIQHNNALRFSCRLALSLKSFQFTSFASISLSTTLSISCSYHS